MYREVTKQDALGNITEAWLNDKNLQGNYLYDHVTGQMLFSRAGTVHDVSYYNGDIEGYDSYGNLMAQEMRDSSGQVRTRETFSYDKLHRLIKSDLNYDIGNNGSETEIFYGYDAVGNILKKTDYSVDANDAYQYHNGTNQINSIRLKDSGGTVYFGYDGRGNQVSRGSSAGNLTHEVTYNAFNKPTHITKNSQDISLSYGADIMRFKQVRREENKDITTWYIGKHFEVEVNELTNVTTNRHFISDVAIVNIYNNQVPQILFTHRDRLGSAITLTDENNNADVRRFFDPFGKPRVGDNWSLWESLGFSSRLMNLPDHEKASYKGFTDHEHLDEAELIHMNGRVYDYNVGRFISVDPLIHLEGGSQGINPYSYIFNNPLSGTDPTGYEPEEIKFKVKRSGSRIQTTVKATVNVSNGTADIELTSGSGDAQKAVTGAIGKTANKINSTTSIGGQQEVAKSGQRGTTSQGGSAGHNQHIRNQTAQILNDMNVPDFEGEEMAEGSADTRISHMVDQWQLDAVEGRITSEEYADNLQAMGGAGLAVVPLPTPGKATLAAKAIEWLNKFRIAKPVNTSKTTIAVSQGLPHGIHYGAHTILRMAERGITKKMLEIAIRRGRVFWDPKNKTIQFIVVPTSGKNFSVAINPITMQITTGMRQRKSLILKRFKEISRESLGDGFR